MVKTESGVRVFCGFGPSDLPPKKKQTNFLWLLLLVLSTAKSRTAEKIWKIIQANFTLERTRYTGMSGVSCVLHGCVGVWTVKLSKMGTVCQDNSSEGGLQYKWDRTCSSTAWSDVKKWSPKKAAAFWSCHCHCNKAVLPRPSVCLSFSLLPHCLSVCRLARPQPAAGT